MTHERHAVGLMLFAAAVYALFPLAAKLSGAEANPFLFNAANHAAAAVVCAWWLRAKLARGLFPRGAGLAPTLVIMVGAKHVRYIALCALGGTLSLPLFVMSLRSIDPTAATVLYETQHLIFIFLSMYLLRSYAQYRKDRQAIVWLAILSLAILASVYLVTVGEKGEAPLSMDDSRNVGIGIAMLGAVFSAFPRLFAVVYAKRVAASLHAREGATPSARGSFDTQIGCAVFCVLAYYALSALASLSIALWMHGVWWRPGTSAGAWSADIVVWGVLIGVLGSGFGGIALRKAHLLTGNLAVNALSYLTPVIALAILMAAGLGAPERLDYVVIGAIGIVVCNILLQMENRLSSLHKVLALAAWLLVCVVSFVGSW